MPFLLTVVLTVAIFKAHDKYCILLFLLSMIQESWQPVRDLESCRTPSEATQDCEVLLLSSARRYQNLFIGISNEQFITIYRYIVLTTVVLCM